MQQVIISEVKYTGKNIIERKDKIKFIKKFI